MGKTWTCPYCNRPCTVGDHDVRIISSDGYISEEYGHYRCLITIIVCPNEQCRQRIISLAIYQYADFSKKIFSWQLLPESEAKPFPEYIPTQLRNDYAEACLIKNKSPKASATLSRRCLQGMIRDFWEIRKGRLIDEIDELKTRVDPNTWKAIDSVRYVGNIGAHMANDVNLIMDVEPKEAALLIWLIETLFEEWYIARHERETKMKALVELAKDKKAPQQTDASEDK